MGFPMLSPGLETGNLVGPRVGIGDPALEVEGDDAFINGSGDETVFLLRVLHLTQQAGLVFGKCAHHGSDQQVHRSTYVLIGHGDIDVRDFHQEQPEKDLNETEQERDVNSLLVIPEAYRG